MKILTILLLNLLGMALSQPSSPNYNNRNADDMLTGRNCRTVGNSAYIKSPILIEDSICTPYADFSLEMTDVSETIGSLAPSDSKGTIVGTYGGATLKFNGSTYTSVEYHFRSQSEHVLYRDGRRGALELQIMMTGGPSEFGALSFFIQPLPATTDSSRGIYTDSDYYRVFANSDETTFNARFSLIADAIKSKMEKEAFLNIFVYDGTRTFGECELNTWFIYASELYMESTVIEAIRTRLHNTLANDAPSLNINNRFYQDNINSGGGGERQIKRVCYTGYFKVHLSDNYGLWFGVGSILLFFIFTLSFGDKPLVDYDFHESVWSIHPFVSIAKYGNEIHTKKTRSSLFLSMITIIGLFASVFYRDASDPKKGSNTIVFAIYAVLIDLVITFFVGNMLRGYYIAKYQYYKTKEEAWEQKAQNRIFSFYISVFVIVVVGWSFTVWNMGELHAEIDPEASELWVASFFIGIGLEMIVFYPLFCILSRGSNFFRRMSKSVGFMYDNLCHETYMDFIKHD